MPSFRNRRALVESLRAMGSRLTVHPGQLTEAEKQMLTALELDGLVEITTDAERNTRTYRLCTEVEFGA